MKIILWIVVLSLCLISFLVILSMLSRRKPSLGLIRGRLRSCAGRPNCVCSEDKGLSSYVKPVAFSGSAERSWECAKRVIQELEGKIVFEEDGYLWATFRTRIFRFVDDVELRMDEENGLVHIRSSSRVGYSDMGTNRRRVEVFRARFSQSFLQ